MKISAVILTKNEETNIERCLKTVDFCDEIVIVDDFSEDKTVEIAHKVLNAQKVYKVLQRRLNGNFSSQRNFGMEKTNGDWILFVDADETIPDELKKEIKQLLSSDPETKDYTAYYIKRRDFFWGRELKFGEIRKARARGVIRLVKRNSGYWVGNVHEEFKTIGFVTKLTNFINHYPHPTLKEFIEDINFYSSLRAEELYQSGKKFCLGEAILLPFSKFILTYFIYGGFLDEVPGFTYAFLMSLHSFLVRAKLFQLYENKKNR
ncbi:hypothetical protein COS31_03525 [Candidatus Roizmanbacteria bacterium CG02_land_8_20_14_3_00_36_15]|uniref:Glycosyltransferase 2-like domain-containing protein n=1 Tax=Candidatus Roizmanbacteria bacterium CG10_big_fil_rev_8_21_14_0_10_36_26 TaxID=1974851 RepID=A0A2M8KMK4_9BACT|nr:MAG: hypothetical protein COS51_03735 [Candidatus Roizmanbacteria bacterium CG03_land_8_20_14_0_80_36_21]PIV37635.1 MAG: hypothetical protein COS31_03525 [Candidatus Roizmanbacteria bacterium CG02_land_8_20_14_3_00_36_15]PIY69952.1 MAG: hypothetical protein COY89_03825 [Candidatus Roizmanbacteria bacterium CG_4_10_14_0_8_um_filter_36_36]PJA53052.1 MAG: hypothetical protein CO166_03200 [Candidatus Roizmanbacteria bacterium CG_4_9_14_3_um_filter_36_11]PJE61139.1 MAG: hypothetical protein COU86